MHGIHKALKKNVRCSKKGLLRVSGVCSPSNILIWETNDNSWQVHISYSFHSSFSHFLLLFSSFFACSFCFKLSLIPDTLCSWESLHFENTWHSGKYTLYVKNQWWHNIYSPKAKNLCFFMESKCLETSFLLLSYRHQRIIIPQFSTQWLEWVPAQLSEGLAHFMDFLNTEMDISIIIFFPKLWTNSLCLREGHLFSAKIFI